MNGFGHMSLLVIHLNSFMFVSLCSFMPVILRLFEFVLLRMLIYSFNYFLGLTYCCPHLVLLGCSYVMFVREPFVYIVNTLTRLFYLTNEHKKGNLSVYLFVFDCLFKLKFNK